MEAIQGCTKTVSFQTDVLCDTCGMFINKLCVVILHWYYVFSWVCIAGGSGVPPGTKPETCKRCKGSGVVSIVLELS